MSVFFSKVQLVFSMGILEGVKWQTSQADYNGQNSSDTLLGKGRTLLKWADQLLIKMLGDV